MPLFTGFHRRRGAILGVRSLVFFLARRQVRRRALQSVLTTLGVAVGVMVLLVALSLTNGFIDQLVSSTLKATPHVTLSSFDGGQLRADVKVQKAISESPGVTAVSPYLSAQGLIARRADATKGISGRQGFVQLLGINPGLEQRVLQLQALDQNVSALQRGGIVLGQTLARQLGVLPGDPVFVRDISGHSQTFTVAGTFAVGNELIDGVVAYVSLGALQDFLHADGMISGYHVRVDKPQQASRIGQQLEQHFGLLATSWESLYSSLLEQLRLQKALISVVVFLIVLVAAMGIANILVLTVAEKTEEIAILRALGASRRQILSVFTLEGVILGGGGTLLGLLLSLGVGLYFKLKPYPLPGNLYFITQLPVHFQAWDFVWVCALAIATSVVAALIPARRASNVEPAKILR